MVKVVYDNDEVLVVHLNEYDDHVDVFAIANGNIEVRVKGIKRRSPFYNCIVAAPVSDEGWEDTYLIFSDIQHNEEQNPELWAELDAYWLHYKINNYEDFYDENGNPW